MGVKHLWSILESACKQGSYDDLAGKTAAVDLSIWIVECRSIQSSVHRHSLHLRTLFFRVLNMIYFNIKPIFVLDSTKILDLKLHTVSKRRLAKKNNDQSQVENVPSEKNRFNFNILVNECCQLLNYLGLPIIRADGEAEKLCAQLNRMNIVDVVITNDSDCFVYGAKTIIRNFGIDMKSISFDVYDRHEIESTCRLDHRALLTLTLLLGSDYDTQGVQGIGPESALKFLHSLPANIDPVDYLRTMLTRNDPKNKYEQRILSSLRISPKCFDEIIHEYSSSLDNLPAIASIAAIKWLKPVRIKQLESYMKKKLGWIESYTFLKVLPLMTRFQMLYRLNMLELDIDDMISLSNMMIFEPICIRKVRIRQLRQYYDIEWKQLRSSSSTQVLEEQMANLSVVMLDDDDDDDDDDKLITVEPSDLFRQAYPDVVSTYEGRPLKAKKPKKMVTTTKIVLEDEMPIIKPKKIKAKIDDSNKFSHRPSTAAMSTSMSLDLLSVINNQTFKIPSKTQQPSSKITKNRAVQFNHRPTMAALSTSISIDVLSVLQKPTSSKQSKSRPVKHHTQSDMTGQKHLPATLLNTSLSLDILDILMRDKHPIDNDECQVTKVLINRKKKPMNDDNTDVLPLPLWDRIRQRTVVG